MSILASLLPQLAVADCPSITPQTTPATASRGKLGWVPCLDECPPRYFLGMNSGVGDERLDVSTFEKDSWSLYYEWIQGTRIQLDPDRDVNGNPWDPGCGQTTCYPLGSSNSFEIYSRTWSYRGFSGTEGCFIVDGVPNGCTPVAPDCPTQVILETNVSNCAEQVYKVVKSISSGSQTVTCTARTGTWYSDEYTTARIVAQAQAKARENLVAFSTDNPIQGQDPYAYCSVDAAETCAEVGLCNWRAKITGTEQGKRYRITYKVIEHIQGRGTQTNSSAPVEVLLTAPAETWFFPSEPAPLQVSFVPGDCPSSTPGVHTLTYTSFGIERVPDGLPPGTGGPDQPGTGSGCSSCSGGGSADPYPGLNFRIGMGNANGGGSAGEFQIRAAFPSLDLATPSALEFTGEDDTQAGVSVTRNSHATLTEVHTPTATATISALTPYSYQILISVSSEDTLWTIENPDASQTVYNRLRVTRHPPSGPDVVWLYTFDVGTATWTLTFPDALTEQRFAQFTDPISGNRTEVFQILTPGGPVVSEVSRVYATFSWGSAIISETLGAGASARTTQYSYYAPGEAGYPAPTANQPPLKQVLRPDGTWEYYLSYDIYGRPLQVLYGIDTAPTSTPNLCRSIEYAYSLTEAGDSGSLKPHTPRKILEKVKGTPVALTYHLIQTGVERELRCADPTVSYAQAAADPNTLVTVTTYYTSEPNLGRVANIQHPDGTMSFFQYTQNFQTNSLGQPNATKTAIQEGTQTITEFGFLGDPWSVEVWNLSGSEPTVRLSRDLYTTSDPLWRPETITHLDNTSEQMSYDCCGLHTTTDRDGLVTLMEHDPMHRLVGKTVLSYPQPLSLTNVLDAAGRVTAVVRNGGGNSPIVQQQFQFDTAGFVTRETNALLGVTVYSDVTDFQTCQRTRTVTYPDSGTRIELYGADGSLLKVTGTAVQPVRYEYGVETAGPDLGKRYTKEIKLNGARDILIPSSGPRPTWTHWAEPIRPVTRRGPESTIPPLPLTDRLTTIRSASFGRSGIRTLLSHFTDII